MKGSYGTKKLMVSEAIDQIKAICQLLDPSVAWSCTDTAFITGQIDKSKSQLEKLSEGEFSLTIQYKSK